MIPRECKRLAEVDFPIAAVSACCAREKAIRHGHPAAIHLWWARRPLAACRAVLLALLLPDPRDERCPPDFKQRARAILGRLRSEPGATDAELARSLLRFIAEASDWSLSRNPHYLDVARALISAAYGDDVPLVVDPFAGGGSIPLEASRLGADAMATDLNPVSSLIQRVELDLLPRQQEQLLAALESAGQALCKSIGTRLAACYPRDPDGAQPIAYLWARTIRCESQGCGAEVPLLGSLWLCKKAARRRALNLKPVVRNNREQPPDVEFEIFEPASETQVRSGTVNRARAVCPACNRVVPPPRVRAQLEEQRGGADVRFDQAGKRVSGARLMAVATLVSREAGRQYRLPTDSDYRAVWEAGRRLSAMGAEWVPDEPLPPIGTLGFRVQRYGARQWSDLFNVRQRLALATVAEQIATIDGSVAPALALALGKLVDLANAVCRWEPKAECPRNVFAAGRVKPPWDFAEGVPISDSSGSLAVCIRNLVEALRSVGRLARPASCDVAAAQRSPLPDQAADVWFTDPPYYNAYPYADLSDAFFVWLKRALPRLTWLRDPFDDSNPLTPKALEAVQDESRKTNGGKKDKAFFEGVMAESFAEGKRVLKDSGIGCVVFAHKTTEGWEALIAGIIRGGLTITASWPIATEQAHRLRAKNSAALATSVHLVCRPRPDNAPIGDWGDVYRELPRRVGDWMEHLQAEGLRGADLVFACIGPAIEIYSQYSKVVDAQEREIPLGGDPNATEPHQRGFLAYVWEVIGRMALEQVLGTAEARARNGAAGAVEEDGRLTALFLWTLQATEGAANGGGEDSDSEDGEEDDVDDEGDEEEGPAPGRGRKPRGLSLVFDVVRRFAQPLGIRLPEWEGRIIETEKGVVRLLPISERAGQLFGEGGASALADRLEQAREPKTVQLSLFTDEAPPARGRGGRRGGAAADVPDTELRTRRQATTLDRVHAAMLLQAAGRANALRALLQAEVERGPEFVRLANALSALYPKDSEEKRLLDAMLLAVPR